MTIKEIQKKYNCSYDHAVNIKCKLNTPEQLGLEEVKKSHQEKVQDEITKKIMGGLQHKASKFTVKESNDDDRTIKGYASVFGNLDSDMDVIKKGAFNKSVKEWGPEGKDRIKLVAQHDISRPVAKITILKEDSNGLYMEAKFGNHRDGQDYYAMAKDGIINEFSVGFVPVEKEDNEKGGYDISSIKLYEVSMVTIAANEEAVVTEVKEANPLKLVKQIEDKDLAFKLEREILRLMSKEAVTETAPKKGASEQIAAKSIEEELIQLYKS